MNLRLKPGFALESWANKPFCLVNEEKRFLNTINREEFRFLMACDGHGCAPDQAGEPGHTDALAERFLAQEVVEQLDAPDDSLPAPSLTIHEGLHRSSLQLAITGRCNMHCRHCLAADGQGSVSSQLSLEDCEHIFDEMLANRVFELWITGGEPLIHPRFRDIYRAACDRGLHVTKIFTNAWLVDDELLSFVEGTVGKGRRPQFVISFDGLGTHDWMRCRTGAEERTLAAIRLLRDRGFSVRIGLNVNSVTAPSVIETCRTLALDYGVTSIRPIYTNPTPRWNEALATDVEPLDIGDYYDLMIELIGISRTEGWRVPIDALLMPHIHLADGAGSTDVLVNPPQPNPKRHISTACGRASNTIFVSSDARVLPCSGYEGETTMLGVFQGDDVNILKTPLAQILTASEYATEFAPTLSDIMATEPECAACEWLSLCCGGCLGHRMVRKYWDVGNPSCAFYKGGYAAKYLRMLEQ